ncbi:MAG: hypothetical protein AAF570_05265, partial [Bacteroidota bacterium]
MKWMCHFKRNWAFLIALSFLMVACSDQSSDSNSNSGNTDSSAVSTDNNGNATNTTTSSDTSAKTSNE